MLTFASTRAVTRQAPSASRRALSTTNGVTAGATQQSTRLVISRRVWEAHKKTMPPKPKPQFKKQEDKPWPRNVQLFGYAVTGVLVPYTAVWLITANPTLRDTFGRYLPMQQLRTHFGELEWDSHSFADSAEEVAADYHQFPEEPSYSERQKQEQIDAIENSEVTANVYWLGDGQIKETKRFPGTTKAQQEVIVEAMGASQGQTLAVDFEDDAEEQSLTDDNMSELESMLGMGGGSPTDQLLRDTHTFSSWYYLAAQPQQSGQPSRASDGEIERLRLEYTVDDLESSLMDPSCTRDHDEMRDELRKARQDLSRLKWKRRLGL